MGSIEDLQKLLSSLDIQNPTHEQVQLLTEVSQKWFSLVSEGVKVTEALKGNIILPVLAKVMDKQYLWWREKWPKWIDYLAYCTNKERDFENELFPLHQMREVVNMFRKYILGGHLDCLESFKHFAAMGGVRSLLLHDNEVYDMMKRKLDQSQLEFFFAITGDEEWQRKILSDKPLIFVLLSLPDSTYIWNLFINIAQHPDAKTLLPKEVMVRASGSTYIRRTDLCALLCNEDDLNLLSLSTEWIEYMKDVLQKLVTVGKAIANGVQYHLLHAVLPIVNLSVVDAQKEPLGRQFIPLLMEVVTGEVAGGPLTTRFITRARREAAKALWNFAYLESNRALISGDDGIAKLNKTLEKSDDVILKKNVAGILHMFTSPATVVPQERGQHVMLSYNWGNQSIVKRIASSLEEKGYEVWLDIERMNGSTLEATIEQAAVVLICMSQKYKDSPNCRLEGEYCVNKKVKYVPLMMQEGYRPDGWLGITLGSHLYYEFTNEENWNNKMTALTKAIGERGRMNAPKKTEVEEKEKEVQQKKPSVDWTDEDMRAWMKAERIDQHYELFKTHKFDRRALLELQRLLLRSPSHPSFFFQMFKEAGVTEYGEILRLSSAIHTLIP